jgi:hypothetical protein
VPSLFRRSRGADRLLCGVLHDAGSHRRAVAGTRFRYGSHLLYRRGLHGCRIRHGVSDPPLARSGELCRRSYLRSVPRAAGHARSGAALGGIRDHAGGNVWPHIRRLVHAPRSIPFCGGLRLGRIPTPYRAAKFGIIERDPMAVGMVQFNSGSAPDRACASLPWPGVARLALHPRRRSILPRGDGEPDDDRGEDWTIPDLPARLPHVDCTGFTLERARTPRNLSGLGSCANGLAHARVLCTGPPPVGPGPRAGGRLLFWRFAGRPLRELSRSPLSQPRISRLLDRNGSGCSDRAIRLARCSIRPLICRPRFIRRSLSSGGEPLSGAAARDHRRPILAVPARQAQEGGARALPLVLAAGVPGRPLCLAHLRLATPGVGPRW